MKLRISHLETPTQEVFFLLTVMSAFFTVVGCGLFLFTPFQQLEMFFGILGTDILFQVFYVLGFATFLIAVNILLLGSVVIARCHHFKEFIRHLPF